MELVKIVHYHVFNVLMQLLVSIVSLVTTYQEQAVQFVLIIA
jgi:hypothetical protein